MNHRRAFEKSLFVTVAVAGLLASASTFADVVKTQVVAVKSVTESKTPLYEIFTAEGRVYSTTSKQLAQRLTNAAAREEVISLVTNDDLRKNEDENEHKVIAVKALTEKERADYVSPLAGASAKELILETMTPALASDLHQVQPSEGLKGESDPAPRALVEARSMGFEPTILASDSDAQSLFDSERNLKSSSQCHERAMVWAYDMYTNRGVKSMKTMMFFTDKFRSKYGVRSNGFWGPSFKPYKWWYHTAPYVYVGNKEVVLDKEFRPGPEQMDEWTYWFTTQAAYYAGVTAPTLEQAKCREISKYKEYPANANYDDCLLRKLPMYYMMPASFEALDCDPSRENAPGRSGFLPNGLPRYPCYHEVLTGFQKWTIERAYSNAGTR